MSAPTRTACMSDGVHVHPSCSDLPGAGADRGRNRPFRMRSAHGGAPRA